MDSKRPRLLRGPRIALSYFRDPPILPSGSSTCFIFKALSLVLFLCCEFASAQEYPVRATIILTPPYSIYLSDYSSPDHNLVQVFLQLRDLDRFEYKVKLRLTIEGNGLMIRTRGNYIPAPIILQGGMTETLNGYDLRAYFNPDNLDFTGISRSDFIRTGALPEGHYTFNIEVLDYFRSVQVSNAAATGAWVMLNDPPFINVPVNNEKVRASDPQNIFFSWMPGHAGSPNAAFATEYEFSLVEIFPPDRDPNDAVRVSMPLYIANTTATSLQYGLTEPMLIPGRRYAFRVRAFDRQRRHLFKNNGYSEVFVFTFGDACTIPENINARVLDASRIKLQWSLSENLTGVEIRYKKQANSTWITEINNSNSAILPGLNASTSYELQVKGLCGSLQSEYSPSVVVKTEGSRPSFSCGSPPLRADPKSAPIEMILRPGDHIFTGDFEITLTEIAPNRNKTFRGRGFAFMPWLNETAVEVRFSEISINKDFRVFHGDITTVFSAGSRFARKIDLDDTSPFKDDGENSDQLPVSDSIPLVRFTGDIQSVSIDTLSGNLLLISPDGTPTELEREKLEDGSFAPMTIADSEGDTWVVDAGGNVSYQAGTPSRTDPAPDVSNQDYTIRFIRSPGQKHGFDDNSAFGDFRRIEIRNQPYVVPWKSMESGQSDELIATRANGSMDFSPIGFGTTSWLYSISNHANGKTISVQAGHSGDSLSAYIISGADSTAVEVGRVSLVSYPKQKGKVVIVPVNDALPLDASRVQDGLNTIYGQAVFEWDVAVAEVFQIDQQMVAGIDSSESAWLSSFPEKMKRFNRVYTWENNLDDDAYYIFIVKGSGSRRAGFMPFKRRFGYVFVENSPDLVRTIAHELGHGAFGLQHTFEQFDVPRGSTDNLMDHGSGTHLKKYQWDQIHLPHAATSWLMDDDESAYIDFRAAFIRDVAAGSGTCWTEGVEHGFELFGRYEIKLAVYAGFIRMLVCETREENCGEGGIGNFSCGMSNGFLQEIDWVTMLESVRSIEIDPAELLACMYHSIPLGTSPGVENPDFRAILFKCLTGVEIGQLVDKVEAFIVENWDDPYHQGQATAFVLTLFTPFKGKILEKLRHLPRYSGKISKLEQLSAARNSDELVEMSRSLVTKARVFSQAQIDEYVAIATKNPYANKVMLGKYKEPGTLSYIERAGPDHTYFDLGDDGWAEARSIVDNGLDRAWEEQMWRINKKFIDDQKALGKDFFFSHEPWKAETTSFFSKEAEYLIDIGAKDFEKVADNLWRVVW